MMRIIVILCCCACLAGCNEAISVGDKIDLCSDSSKLWQGSHAERMLVVYSETGMCVDCWQKQFIFWRSRINRMDNARPDMKVVFILYPSRNEDMDVVKQIEIGEAAIVIDSTRLFYKKNHLRRNGDNNCFVIDRSNEVLFVGNPLFSNIQWEEILSI